MRKRILITYAVGGILFGLFVLDPLDDFVYFHEHYEGDSTAISYVINQAVQALKGQTPQRSVFYGITGALLGFALGWLQLRLAREAIRLSQLNAELNRQLPALIAQGEGDTLEFKASFRWDLRQKKVNRGLEGVVVKTIAGFMNLDGGSLLIGVSDDGEVLGLDDDFSTLKRQDSDGFEQALRATLATKLGADLGPLVQIAFHEINDREVCRVIAQPARRPVYTRDNKPQFFLRSGSSTRELNLPEAIEYIGTRWPGRNT